MNPVNWFEIPVNDLARATAFYEAVFQLTLTRTEMGNVTYASFPMEQGAAGSAGALVMTDDNTPSKSGTLVYLHVNDIESTLARVLENGGRILMAKTSIGKHGFMAHFEDSEGNRVALHSGPDE